MKVGVRKPSVSKRVKARTTGRAKRAVKKAVIPYYGKKGTGIIKDPKKAVYNKVYRKTTVGVDDIIAVASSSNKGKKRANLTANRTYQTNPKNAKGISIVLKGLAVLFFMVAALGLLAEVYSLLVIGLIAGAFSWYNASKMKRASAENDTIAEERMVDDYHDANDEVQPDITIDVETHSQDFD